jgi:hypothetical protein
VSKSRKLIISFVAAVLATNTVVSVVSAQDDPAFVGVCFDPSPDTWGAEPGQPILFGCGFGATTLGGLRSFLTAEVQSFFVQDSDGNVVLAVGPGEAEPGWGTPERFPSGDEEVSCASPYGWGVFWTHELEEGLPEGIYTVTWTEPLRHPVNDGSHTCWFSDGERAAPPPSLSRGTFDAVSTLVVAPGAP